jgi:DNA-binding GntR family transcriptional regulator
MEFAMDINSKTRSVRDVVYEKIKEAILMGEYKPGFHLNERQLAGEYMISTTPLKEALRRLEQEGLVVTRPRVGSFVSNDVMVSIEEINLIRSAIEGVAARLAAIKIDEDEIIQLGEVLKEMERYRKERNPEKALEVNLHFHKLITIFAKNNYVSKQIEAIRSFDLAPRNKTLSNFEELDRAYKEHELIYKMISMRDPDGAENAVRAHIHRSTQFVLKKSK